MVSASVEHIGTLTNEIVAYSGRAWRIRLEEKPMNIPDALKPYATGELASRAT